MENVRPRPGATPNLSDISLQLTQEWAGSHHASWIEWRNGREFCSLCQQPIPNARHFSDSNHWQRVYRHFEQGYDASTVSWTQPPEAWGDPANFEYDSLWGWRCKLCDQFCDAQHIYSRRHRSRLEGGMDPEDEKEHWPAVETPAKPPDWHDPWAGEEGAEDEVWQNAEKYDHQRCLRACHLADEAIAREHEDREPPPPPPDEATETSQAVPVPEDPAAQSEAERQFWRMMDAAQKRAPRWHWAYSPFHDGVYFYNTLRNVTTWDPPPPGGLAVEQDRERSSLWDQFKDRMHELVDRFVPTSSPDHEGNMQHYFINEVTRERAWRVLDAEAEKVIEGQTVQGEEEFSA